MSVFTDKALSRFINLAAIAVLSVLLTVTNIMVASAAKQLTPIPVPKNVIFPGQVISAGLLRDRMVPVDYLNRVSVQVTTASTVGMVARTTLMPNQPIFTNAIVEPDVVRVNRPTIMEYVSGTLRITAEVLPMVSAKKGEFVRARNIHNGSIVTGIAMADGTIMARAN